MKKINLLSLFVIITLSSANSFAKSNKCELYEKALIKAEKKATELLESGKASSAGSQVKAYQRALRNYKKTECPDIENYAKKQEGLTSKVEAAKNKGKCEGYRAKLDTFDGNEVKGLIESGEVKSAARWINKYDKQVERLVKANCEGTEVYEKQAASYFGLMNGKQCKEIAHKMTILEEQVNQIIADKNPDSARLRERDIKSSTQQYSNALNRYKNTKCAEDYSVYEAKTAQWQVSSDPYGYYHEALENDDVAAAELAIDNGVDISSSMVPFEQAVKKNALGIVKLLVEKGVDINPKDGELHPLNYSMESGDKKVQLNMVKWLLSLGADITKSNSDAVIKLASQVGDMAFIKQLEPTPLSAENYAACYWTVDSKYSELESYCIEQIKAGSFGKNWSDINEGMKDRSLSKDILSVGNKVLTHESNRTGAAPVQMEKVKIDSAGWTVKRNALGVILDRTILARGFVKNKYDLCYTRSMRVKQQHDGNTYLQTRVELLGRKDIDCD